MREMQIAHIRAKGRRILQPQKLNQVSCLGIQQIGVPKMQISNRDSRELERNDCIIQIHEGVKTQKELRNSEFNSSSL
jgi:hypothetical protein